MPFVKRKDLDALICAGQTMHHWLIVVDRAKHTHETNGVRKSQAEWKATREQVFPGWNTPLERKIEAGLRREKKQQSEVLATREDGE